VSGDPRATVGEFYRAWMNRDWDALRAAFAEDVVFEFSGRNPFAGSHRGREAVVAVLRAVVDRTGDSFRAAMPDTWDIAASEHHTILVDLYRVERGGREFRFYLLLLCALEDERIVRMFTYFDDQYGFDEFFS
jgi:ketosteroid isomerase-like protein